MKSNNGYKTIWIDLDNSPHVPFFSPIIRRFAEKKHNVFITARDCAQTCGLADYYKFRYRKVGRHYGKNKVLKVLGTLVRAVQLMPVAARVKPAAAVCHGSRAMVLASNLLRIPSVILMDYEFGRNLPFSKPTLLIFPEVVAASIALPDDGRVRSYPGIKEDVYVPFFEPSPAIKDELELGDNSIVVTIRPPATEAHYHNAESEGLFGAVLDRLGAVPNLKMVILPRNEIKQTAWIKEKWPELIRSGKILIPSHVVDGLNLIWHSDLVVSGGGTMNREAAALGVPVYSIFRGPIGAVDRYLESKGRLTLLASVQDVQTMIDVRKRDPRQQHQQSESRSLDSIMTTLFGFIGEGDSADVEGRRL
jgi:predicted glycosyltransferase